MTRKSPDPEYMTMTFKGVSREAARLFDDIYQIKGGMNKSRGEVLSEMFYEIACDLFTEKAVKSTLRDYSKAQEHLESLDKE